MAEGGGDVALSTAATGMLTKLCDPSFALSVSVATCVVTAIIVAARAVVDLTKGAVKRASTRAVVCGWPCQIREKERRN